MSNANSTFALPYGDGTVIGRAMYDLAAELFPICRSLTGPGVRETLRILQRELPELTIHEVPSGTPAFDWIVPDEWAIRDAYLLDPDGRKIVDFKNHNLHVVGYSEPVNVELDLAELQSRLHSIPEQPDAIPYVTAYYKRTWGFCLTHRQREALKPGRYRAVIDSTLAPGHLTYGEVLLPGALGKEIFVSTYVCHPSMANNELSGPVVTTWLVNWLKRQPRRFAYRIVFLPETIGSITYLSRNLAIMKERVVAGFNVTCVGDERVYSYLPSRQGGTLADRAARHVLKHVAGDYVSYSFLRRGSDERQYCWPGVDLPVCSVMRSKYGEYPEYHTSLDNMDLITPNGLAGSFFALQYCAACVEENRTYRTAVLCEPQLGRRGLYPVISKRGSASASALYRNILAYCDGANDLLAVADILGVPMWTLFDAVAELRRHDLLVET